MLQIMQGDAYNIPIEILLADGTVAEQSDFTDVEIAIGNNIKSLSKKEITYDEENKVFLFPLKQEDSFDFFAVVKKAQVRVKTPNGEVFGIQLDKAAVIESISKVVL